MNYSAEALGQVVRTKREAHEPPMSQEALGGLAGYGKGAGVSISRIEGGLARPGAQRFAGIARALDMTPEQLGDEANALAATIAQRKSATAKTFREQLKSTKERHAALLSTIEGRAKIVQELAEAFNDAHDTSRDDFFMTFVRAAETVEGAAAPAAPHDDEAAADADANGASVRVESMSAGIAQAILGGAEGALAGAAAGGAAAYGAFTAAAMFGTASTGTAISTLSGVAATNATLATLGGGTLAAGGAGMAGGAMLLTGMVAAPVALLAAGGFYLVKHRRSKNEEERLRSELDVAEKSMNESQAGFDAIVDLLPRATEVMAHVNVHGTRALARWIGRLPAEPRAWGDLPEDARRQYEEFVTIAACVLSISSINFGALLAVGGKELEAMTEVVGETIDYADRTVRELV